MRKASRAYAAHSTTSSLYVGATASHVWGSSCNPEEEAALMRGSSPMSRPLASPCREGCDHRCRASSLCPRGGQTRGCAEDTLQNIWRSLIAVGTFTSCRCLLLRQIPCLLLAS